MTRTRRAVCGLVAAAALACAEPVGAADPLRFCIDQSGLSSSGADGKSDHAFDVRIADAVARRVGRTAAIQWYQPGNEGNPGNMINALLSDGRCDLGLGYPLLAEALAPPSTERARLPGFEGSKPEDRRRWVTLGELRAGRGYRFEAIAVVVGPAAPNLAIRSLSDLKGLRLVVDEGTLGDAILMSSGAGALIPSLTHMSRLEDVFAGMERGDYAATLVELTRFDAYAARHPDTQLKSSGHYHSIGFNVGIVGLTRNAQLMDQVDDAIAGLLGSDESAAIAQATHVTYLPPREPNVRGAITADELRKD